MGDLSHMARTLNCYAQGNSDGWEAICLDLDVAVQGETLPEVHDSLQKAIELYYESVLELPEDDRARLLNRSAPFWAWLKFFTVRILLSRRHTGIAKFTCHAPA